MVFSKKPLSLVTKQQAIVLNVKLNLSFWCDRNNRDIEYQYDLLARLTAEVWLDSDGSPLHTIDYSYDDAATTNHLKELEPYHSAIEDTSESYDDVFIENIHQG